VTRTRKHRITDNSGAIQMSALLDPTVCTLLTAVRMYVPYHEAYPRFRLVPCTVFCGSCGANLYSRSTLPKSAPTSSESPSRQRPPRLRPPLLSPPPPPPARPP
jgi:hypothetical protein